jgi:hypothetical protein
MCGISKIPLMAASSLVGNEPAAAKKGTGWPSN